jgi:hypothetical protein
VDQQQQSRLRRIGRQILWTIGAVVALSAVVFVINRFFVHRPLWDWLELLIVPVVLAGGGLWFNVQQTEREQRIANDRAQDEALQAYLDHMSGMLIPPSKDQPSLYKALPGDSFRSVARARTLTVLPRLDGDRKARVVRFLYEARLIRGDRAVLDLEGADLTEADLSETKLDGAQLRGVYLGKANLPWTSLGGADLTWADLSGANLTRAYLHRTNLHDASGCTEGQLGNTSTLEGATMPDGRKYEDWLGTPQGQDWIRKYKKNLGADKKKAGVYEDWIKTPEGEMWLRATG